MDPRKRCTAEAMNLTLTPAYQPGDMDRIFYGMKDKYKGKYNVTYISEDPWVVALDGFMSDLEVKTFLRLVDRWFDLQSAEYAQDSKRSSGGRTGFVSWCTNPKCSEVCH